MAMRGIFVVSHLLLLFALVNFNYADEEPRNEPNSDLEDSGYDIQDNRTNLYLWRENIESKGNDHVRQTRDLKQVKSLKIRLEWFDKKTDGLVGQEYSRDLGSDGTVIEQLGMSITGNVNNGGYDVQPGWVGILQGYFNHRIDMNAFDYQVSFDYREWWEDMRVISFELFTSPYRNENGNLYITLTPSVTGEVVRAIYQYTGFNDPSTMIRVFLLGTSIDCRMNTNSEFEFFPTQKQLVNGQAFEAYHSTHATKTNHHRFSIGKPLQVKITLTVRIKT